MSFGKAPIKGEGMSVDYGREMTDKEKLREAQQYIKELNKQINNTQEDAMRYRRIRQLEVVIMAEEGAKYLKGKELDDYLDTFPARTLSRAEVLKELLPGLNTLFGAEYAKYQEEHAAHIDAQISAEAFLNEKT